MSYTPTDNAIKNARQVLPLVEAGCWAARVFPVQSVKHGTGAEKTARQYPRDWLTPALLLAIIDRETGVGTSPLLRDVSNTPDNFYDDVGDRGHGRGLFQIDDRWHKPLLKGNVRQYPADTWKRPEMAAQYVCEYVLMPAWHVLSRKFPGKDAGAIVRGTVAAYNCGAGNVAKSWREGRDEDYRTSGRNYSADVMTRLGGFWDPWYDEERTKGGAATF